MPTPVSRHAETAELDAVLASSTFAKASNLARLLKYICGQYFEGRTANLKEYNIGVEALGRPTDFDPTTNSLVRVELHRLREKLKRYYETEGIHDAVVIVLEAGKYAPRFVARADIQGAYPLSATGQSNSGPVGVVSEVARPRTPPSVEPPSQPTDSIPTTAPTRPRRRLARFLLPVLAVVFVVVTILFVRAIRLTSSQPTSRLSAGIDAAAMTGADSNDEIRILAGYPRSSYIDHAGKVWGPDRFYSGGRMLSTNPQFIDRTSDSTLYENCRAGEFSYDIPLKPRAYELRLYFAETTYGPNTMAGGGESNRIFNVDLNGQRILNEFDPLADAGANNTADVRVFTDVSPAPDGQLHLHFSKFRGPSPPQDDAILNAIEVVPGLAGKMCPVRIVAQNNSYTDHMGQVWSPDRYASQGRQILHNRPVEQTADPGLYYGERFGNFSYAIPVADGKYALTLHFAETYFGPQNPGGEGVGRRLFDIYCNGAQLVHNFDIVRQAGGASRALAITFHNLQPNPQGKLLISFVPEKNYACVNAIEVTSEP